MTPKILLLVVCSFFLFSSAFAQESVPGEWIVQFRPEKISRFKKFVKMRGLAIRKINEKTALVKGGSREDLISFDDIKYVEPNYIYRMTKTANDQLYSGLWGLNNTGQPDSSGVLGAKSVDLNIENAWELTTGSKNVVVAVIDTGVDFKIPDLKDNAWVNSIEEQGISQVDDDKNGYVDDIHGFNFVANTGDSTDDNGHGSHCAGTIGAKGNDKYGVVGTNWDVSLMAVKFISNDGMGTLENAVKAIDYARKNGAHIMNNSWGGSAQSAILEQAIQDANAAGILFVAAAGNSGSDNDQKAFFPANYATDNVLSVASINNRARLSGFSDFGMTTVHVAAPGENILSTSPQGFATMSGTSMATPHVSGVAALLLANEPQLSFREIKKRIIASAKPLFRLKNKIISGGMVDAYAALTNMIPLPDTSDPTLLSSKKEGQTSSQHPYPMEADQAYKITVPGAKRIAIHFARLETEPNFDFLEILDGSGKSYDKMSGYHNDEYSEIIEGDTIVLRMTSDKTVTKYGFDVDQIYYE